MIEYLMMKPQHASAVAELEKVCFSSPWSEDSILSECSNPLSLWIVALENGHLLGYVGSQTVMGEADMMNLAVVPDRRREGIGDELVSQLVKALKDRDAYSLTLEVRASNQPALGLYERKGFVQVGRRPNYYREPKEDALILRKEWQL